MRDARTNFPQASLKLITRSLKWLLSSLYFMDLENQGRPRSGWSGLFWSPALIVLEMRHLQSLAFHNHSTQSRFSDITH